jgi:prepilin-type N-terminal cleavage/methylation domain-containing protein
MNSAASRRAAACAGFTLTEVLISMGVVSLVLSAVMSTFVFGYRMMYRDSQRLATNANLRYFVSQVSKETLDASEFYIFRDYRSLDGSVDLEADVTASVTAVDGVDLYHGDCLVLVTRVSLDASARVRQFRIYYRVATSASTEAPIRYYESADYGAGGTATSLTSLLNGINLNSTPAYSGSRILAARSRGRPYDSDPRSIYPIFSSEFPTLTKTNENVSINVEIINGSTINNLLSSSSFNYTISPRR